MVLIQQKIQTARNNLILKLHTIACGFEKGGIKVFSSAIYKKVVDRGLKSVFGAENLNNQFRTWFNMPFVF